VILDKIVAYKREFVKESKQKRPLREIVARLEDCLPVPSFADAIRRKTAVPEIIAEIKKASPSKGVIREDFDPLALAESYVSSGASAVSILTDEAFFQGHLDYLRSVHERFPSLPILRKDFVIDEYQIYEARESGASAVLLIVAILDKHQLVDFRSLAEELGMSALTEVHREAEADIAAEMGARIIGINNRDLRTFEVDLRTTEQIVRLLGGPSPDFVFVSESGISTPEDVVSLSKIGVDALLIGETFMRAQDPGAALRALVDVSQQLLETGKQA
jgi:indole-3-glycerol phosphate synthase